MSVQSTPLEAKIVQDILRSLRSRGCWCTKLHGGPYQRAGLPDIIGSLPVTVLNYGSTTNVRKIGQLFGLEAKRLPGMKPTAIQQKALRDMEAAGAIVGVVTSVAEALALLGLE